MVSRARIDGMLLDWGASLFNQPPTLHTKGAPRNVLTGRLPKVRKGKATKGGTLSNADGIRAKLRAVVKRAPEVMVKISGGGKGMIQIKNHMDYISRNGQIELETQDGEVVNGRAELQMLRDEWKYGGFQVAEEGEVKDAFNIVLSMPEGTPALAVKNAARDFAAREFGGYQYAMALHTYDTDPDQDPAKHPHVHLTVKARGLDGTRLNPRKVDLQRWREGFAYALREHGVEAAATSRQARLKTERSEKKSVQEMKHRGEALHSVGKGAAGADRVAKARSTEADVRRKYANLVVALNASPDVQDQRLGGELSDRFRLTRPIDQEPKDRPTGRER
ncbi:relaxase/mobilization nuclease domain-containing protein [Asticcacaulis benevestitus]|uniref:MobA/VirD2-like nuclease domain-containing protein n=1 Tax=Asticcacaulis benevestitus DSM 16100 = ATCC BAA-896 TaxID=1121022 RepID=V4PEY4_9CAUL|nr:relaxase/mobilization nuclease domain-containing protein [Asticcacaulis benevestitus]ESQ92517.1 hypothetical protein ABENE_07730 [Asticcacaulis benevestitus DSM 16100 = ATCC BAA-896]